MSTHGTTAPSEPVSSEELARLVGGRLEGDPDLALRGVASLDEAGPDDLGFLASRRYLGALAATGAEAVLVSEELAEDAASDPDAPATRIVVDRPHEALPELLERFHPPRPPAPGVHPTAVLGTGVVLGEGVEIGPYAVVEDEAALGDRVRIGAHAVVGRGSEVGDDTLLHPHVVLYPGCRVGSRVILHSGVRLGVDGFGYATVEGEHRKIPQVGSCVVGDDVEIGANAAVDRGSIGSTRVAAGVKMDNLVHLGHNVEVGRGSMLVAQVGVAGSSRIGEGVLCGGQAGISGHLEIGSGARIGAQAGVIGDVEEGETVSGYPARDHRSYLRAMALVFKLPELVRRLRAVEERQAE